MLRGNRYQRKRLWKYKKKGRKADGTASLASLCCLDEIRGATFDASFALQFISGTSANTIRAALETDLESYHFAQPLLITFLTLSIAIAFQLTSHFHTWLPKIFYSTYCHSAIQKAQWLPIVLRKKSLLPYVIGFLPVSPGLCLFCRFVVFTLTHFIQAMWLFKYTLNVSATS